MWMGFTQERYHHWLEQVAAYTRRNFPEDERFLFINAWNEWGEGIYLEPDVRTGYASLNTTAKALFGLPYGDSEEPADLPVATKPGPSPKDARFRT